MHTNHVILPAVNEGPYTDFNLEPQMVRVRAPNRGNIHISWPEAALGVRNPAGTTTLEILSEGSSVLLGVDSIITRKLKRVAISEARWTSQMFNVNDSNNTITMILYDPASGGARPIPQTVVMTPGYFSSHELLMGQLLNEIELMFPAEVWYISPLDALNSVSTYVISNAAGHVFAFDPQCSAVRFGKSLWDITALGTYTEDMYNYMTPQTIIGPIFGLPTFYVEFFSKTLTEYTKNPSGSTREGSSNIIYRMYLNKWNGTYDINHPQDSIHDVIPNPQWITLNPDQSLSTIDISLGDMYGRPLFIDTFRMNYGTSTDQPRYFEVDTSGITFDFVMLTEI